MSINSITIDDPKSISSAFNKYFVNIGNSLSNNILAATDCSFNETSLIPNQSSCFFLWPIAVKKVSKHINNLNAGKSGGKFGIPVNIYKTISKHDRTYILTDIYNQCIQTGCFQMFKNYKSSSFI